jgi:hypothetical protein
MFDSFIHMTLLANINSLQARANVYYTDLSLIKTLISPAKLIAFFQGQYWHIFDIIGSLFDKGLKTNLCEYPQEMNTPPVIWPDDFFNLKLTNLSKYLKITNWFCKHSFRCGPLQHD